MDPIQELVDANRFDIEGTVKAMDILADIFDDKTIRPEKARLEGLLKKYPRKLRESEEKLGPELKWKIEDGSLEASPARESDGCYRIGQDEGAGTSYAYFGGKKLATGTLQACMQACQEHEDHEAKQPELEPGWYWYRQEGRPPVVVEVIKSKNLRYLEPGITGSYPVSLAPGTFDGPLKPGKA